MSSATRQADLFGLPQPDLFDGLGPAVPLPARMEAQARPRLLALLDEARRATRMPWKPQQQRLNAIIFHNMANWLPEAEREELRAAFRLEIERLNQQQSV